MAIIQESTKAGVQLTKRDPFVNWEVKDVQFPATAGNDYIIRHNLSVDNPKDVHYRVIKQFTGGSVYEASDAQWTTDFIVLRSDFGGWTGRLLLGTMADVDAFDINAYTPIEPTTDQGTGPADPMYSVQFHGADGEFDGDEAFIFRDDINTLFVGDSMVFDSEFSSNCGDDVDDLSEWDEVAPNTTIVAGAGENGTAGIQWDAATGVYTGPMVYKIITASNRVRMRWSQYIPAGALPLSGYTWYTVGSFHYTNGAANSNSTKQVSLNSTVDGEYFFCRGSYNGTTIAGPTSAILMVEDAWNHIELDIIIHNTAGRIRLWHEDELVLDAENLDTQALGSALIDGVEIGHQYVAGPTATIDNIDINIPRRNLIVGRGNTIYGTDSMVFGRGVTARGSIVGAFGRALEVDSESSIGINLTGTQQTLTDSNTFAVWADSFQVNGEEVGTGNSLTISLTDAQIKALPTTPITLVPAPGAGYRIKLLALWVYLNVVTAVYTNINTTYAALQFSMNNAAGDWVATPVVNDGTLGTPLTRFTALFGGSVHDAVCDIIVPYQVTIDDAWSPQSPQMSYSTTHNLPLVVSIDNNGSGDLTGGNVANNMQIHVRYAIEAIP